MMRTLIVVLLVVAVASFVGYRIIQSNDADEADAIEQKVQPKPADNRQKPDAKDGIAEYANGNIAEAKILLAEELLNPQVSQRELRMFILGCINMTGKEYLKAWENLTAAYQSGKLTKEQIDDVKKYIEEIRNALVYTRAITEQNSSFSSEITVKTGDTLAKLAKEHKTSIDLIKNINRKKDDIIIIDERLRILNVTSRVFVKKSVLKLDLYLITPDGNEYLYGMFPVAVGNPDTDPTPVGTFTTGSLLVKPTWPDKERGGKYLPNDDPDNPLGARWIGFSERTTYGIHGTNDDSIIGTRDTKGCVRMFNDHVIEIYAYIQLGDKIEIVE